MSAGELEKLIFDFAEEKNIIAGICRAEAIELPRETDTPFVKPSSGGRFDPGLVLPGAKSVAVIGVGYAKSPAFAPDGEPRGRIAMYALELDYHVRLRETLEELAARIHAVTVFRYKICVDTGPLPEKNLAVKAGLGFFGKNCLVISKKFGSYFNIGCMITDLELEPSEESGPPECGDCAACAVLCPNGALSGEAFGPLGWARCASYISQKKGELSPEEGGMLGGNLFGCDICQEVCRFNAAAERGGESVRADLMYPKISDILEMTPEVFKARYGKTPVNWAGLKTLKRNAGILAGRGQ